MSHICCDPVSEFGVVPPVDTTVCERAEQRVNSLKPSTKRPLRNVTKFVEKAWARENWVANLFGHEA